MPQLQNARRRALVRMLGAAAAASSAATGLGREAKERGVFTVVTFGDSILDCARYNDYGVHPGALIVHNDDRLFPEFRGRDLRALGPARLEHRARDGGRVGDLARQADGLRPEGAGVALITVGGNDLLGGLAGDRTDGVARFARTLESFVRALPLRPVLLGTVYDPTFGNDARNFLGVDARTARANLDRMNAMIGDIAARHGRLVDLHAHFLAGDPSWFTRTIEPSLQGASEVRAAFLPSVLALRTGK